MFFTYTLNDRGRVRIHIIFPNRATNDTTLLIDVFNNVTYKWTLEFEDNERSVYGKEIKILL
ncbi:hypothetical protein VCHA43P282_90204 [Vibrio chagasii]|nr:hypothetical protein VCHA43P282_90204 [Vibrio chagasii]